MHTQLIPTTSLVGVPGGGCGPVLVGVPGGGCGPAQVGVPGGGCQATSI